jgi:integrase/recombinase XerD
MAARYRSFLLRLPSGVRYWTVVDERYRTVEAADDFLLTSRLGRDLAEGTTQAYATSLALFFQWCAAAGVEWQAAGRCLGRFVFWLQHYDPQGARPASVEAPVRGPRRVNAVLAAVREFLRYAVSVGAVDAALLDALFQVVRDGDVPVEVRGERGAGLRDKPRHRLREPERVVQPATDDEVLGLVRACLNARDRFVVLALWRMGLRRGELTGLRREDVHFVPDAALLGCGLRGPHLHVCRRDNRNGAVAKSRRPRAVPADWLVVRAYDQYATVRDECAAAAGCDFLLVNLYQPPVGGPMRPQALNELLAALSTRAGLTRGVHPHALRHAFGTNVAASGATLDEIKDLLGHAFVTSSEVYMHPSPGRLRAAVDRVALPRAGRESR